MSAPPDWIVEGTRVLYSPSSSSVEAFAGVVDSAPFSCGGTWCVRLRDMDARYRGGARSHVPAAACDALKLWTEPEHDGRPDFADFAKQLRAEARWSAEIHSNDKTGQALSDQRELNRLAEHVEHVGRRLGFM